MKGKYKRVQIVGASSLETSYTDEEMGKKSPSHHTFFSLSMRIVNFDTFMINCYDDLNDKIILVLEFSTI